jgi:Uma2 family endonuclease
MMRTRNEAPTFGHALLSRHRGAEQIMAMPAAHRESSRRWTAREVRELIAQSLLPSPRYELVDGELLVTPSPSFAHQRTVSLLWRILDDYMRLAGIGVALTSPFDVELEPEFISQPDVFVLPITEARRVAGEMPARELLLAAEVLSPSSGRFDRVVKKPRYQRHVPEYWIVDLDARLFERWRPHEDRPEILTEILEWHPPGAEQALRIDLGKFFEAVFELVDG